MNWQIAFAVSFDMASRTLLTLSIAVRFGRDRHSPIRPVNDGGFMGRTMITRDHQDAGGASTRVREFAVVKRSVIVSGQKTSVSLEDAFWISLKDIASKQGLSLSRQLAIIDAQSHTCNLSSAIRLYVLDYFRTRATYSAMIGERRFVATQDIAPVSPR